MVLLFQSIQNEVSVVVSSIVGHERAVSCVGENPIHHFIDARFSSESDDWVFGVDAPQDYAGRDVSSGGVETGFAVVHELDVIKLRFLCRFPGWFLEFDCDRVVTFVFFLRLWFARRWTGLVFAQ